MVGFMMGVTSASVFGWPDDEPLVWEKPVPTSRWKNIMFTRHQVPTVNIIHPTKFVECSLVGVTYPSRLDNGDDQKLTHWTVYVKKWDVSVPWVGVGNKLWTDSAALWINRECTFVKISSPQQIPSFWACKRTFQTFLHFHLPCGHV